VIDHTGREGMKTTYFSHGGKNTKKTRRKIVRRKYRAGGGTLDEEDVSENIKAWEKVLALPTILALRPRKSHLRPLPDQVWHEELSRNSFSER
jgi:hypothetical protein